MDEIKNLIGKYADEGLEQIILSKSFEASITKVKIRPVIIKQQLVFQAESFRGAQVFHDNLRSDELAGFVEKMLLGPLHQGELHHKNADATILVSKKGTVTVKEKKHPAVKQEQENAIPAWQPLLHNREKRTLLPEGKPVPFMRDLGVFTAEGKVVKGMYDKYRQINRFLEFVEDVLTELPKDRTVNILDFGCGKSYLTFALYYYLTELNGYNVHIIGLDLKRDVIENCSRLAKNYGYDGLEFRTGDVADFKDDIKIDMMVTLHACDTATDYALHRAVISGASVVLSVPCCQHEINSQAASNALEPLFRYGLIRERVAALATDALRAELLTANGFKVQLLEFIDMEHTPKNILIRAVRRKNRDKKEEAAALKRCEDFMAEIGSGQKLYTLLYENGKKD